MKLYRMCLGGLCAAIACLSSFAAATAATTVVMVTAFIDAAFPTARMVVPASRWLRADSSNRQLARQATAYRARREDRRSTNHWSDILGSSSVGATRIAAA